MNIQTLRNELTAALKSNDTVKTGTLRLVLSAVKNTAIDKYKSASEEAITEKDIHTALRFEAKKRRESIDAYEKAGRNDLVRKETDELAIIQAYLPPELTDEELQMLVEPIVKENTTDFASVMKQAMQAADGRAEGGRIAACARKLMKTG